MIANIGYLEAKKLVPDIDCVVFSDVDIVPIHLCSFYECGKQPRHLAPYCNTFNYT